RVRLLRAAPLVLVCLLLLLLRPAVGEAQVKIMPFGASATQGDYNHNSYRRVLWQQLQAAGYSVDFVGSQRSNYGGPPPNPDFDLDHESRWGALASDLRPMVQAWAASAQPDIVLIHVGSNDMFQNRSITGTRDEIGLIIDQFRLGRPGVKIVLAQLLPTLQNPGNSNITALNSLLPALVQQKNTPESPVLLVDQNTGFDPAVDTYDGTHPTAAGEAKMVSRWMPAVQTLLGPAPPAIYSLNVTTTGSGTVAKSPERAQYAAGATVLLTATPAAGQLFTGWSGDATGTTNPLMVPMSANRNITANFALAAVTSFTLINSDTDQDIQALAPGATLNLNALPTRNLNIRANTNPAIVGSVEFTLRGAQSQNQMESVAPYALFSDAQGNYFDWPPAVGTYTLTATAYSGGGGGGTPGASTSITFTVTDQAGAVEHTLSVLTSGDGTVSKSPAQATYRNGTSVVLTATPGSGQQFSGWSGNATGTANPLTVTMTSSKTITASFVPVPAGPALVSFTLVNADTDQDIRTLAPGATLDLGTLPTRNLNIRANTNPATVGSVVFELNGTQARSQVESVAPYALFSDSGGDYNAWTPAVG
ncbi:InlB B-repeat-containing protein, partial [Hymenobacter persicinus]